jgi:membrane protein
MKEVLSLGGMSLSEFIRRLLREVRADDCTGRAAQLAYYFLFALFPFLLFLTALLGFLPIPHLLERILALLARIMPQESFGLIQNQVQDLVTQPRGGLVSFGVIAALWTASSAMAAIIDSLNRAYDVKDERPFWKARGLAILLTLAFSVLLILSLVLLMFGPLVGAWIASTVGFGGLFQLLWNILRWPVIVILATVAVTLLYYYAPNAAQPWRWITPGAVVAIVAWVLVSLGFSYYVNNFGAYNKTYGSIGAVIVLLVWLYLSGFFLLVGGEINAIVAHPSAKKNTFYNK